MKRGITIATILLLAACQSPTPKRANQPPTAPVAARAAEQPARIFDLPYVQKELDNGLKVIVIKTPQKGMVSVQIPVRTGSRNETEPGKSGFAHFFEHMMFRGTPKYPADAYGAIIQSVGADQNAFTDDDWTNYYTNFPAADLEQVLELEADRFQNLTYTEEQFRTEALAVKGEYLKNYANPLLKALERLQDLAYTQHTYKHTTMGFYQDIENMPNEMAYAKTFFERWYKPEYATVIVAGDVELEPTLALVQKHWGSWKRGTHQAQIPAEPPQTEARYAHVAWEGPTLPWMVFGWKSPAFEPQKIDSAALAVLSEVYFGQTSELYQKLVVREQLVDQFYAQPARNVDSGLFLLALRLTDAKHAKAVTEALQETLLRARTVAVPAPALADSKSFLRYSFAAQLDSAASIGATSASFVRFERDLETINRFYGGLARVNQQDILDAANRVFTDHNRTLVSLSKDSSLDGANGFSDLEAQVRSTPVASTSAIAKAPVLHTTPVDQPLSAAQRAARDRERNWRASIMRMNTRVLELKNNSPLVDVAIAFQIGAKLDPEGEKGITALAAALVAEGGAQGMSYTEIQKAYYPLASGLNVQVDKELVKFSATVHRDNLERWWTLASSQLLEPNFNHEDFWRLKQQQLNGIRVSLRANNDEELAKELLYEKVYGPAHPYGTLTAGRAGQLEKITLDQVRRHWNTRFGRERVQVAVAGDYPADFPDRLLADLGKLRSMEAPRPIPTAVTPASQRSAYVVHKNTSSVAVSMGFPIDVRRGHPDWLALWLVRSWLGEHRNSSAHLYNRIRELRGMNYGDYAYIEYFPNGMFLMQPEPNYPRQNDLFQVWLRPLRSNTDALFATRAALYEIDRLVDKGLDAEQFERTRTFLKKYVDSLTATQTKQLGYLLDSAYYGIPAFNEYVKAGLDQLTLEQVNAAIRKHLRLDGLQLVMISKDAKDLAKRLGDGSASPITYNTAKPEALLVEDRVIAKYPLGLDHRNVHVLDEPTVFE